jgi:Xaa-Pro dipeptidase
MSTAMWKPAGPMSSSEFQTIDVDRVSDIQHKHTAVTQFLESRRFDALLLQRPSNFSWFTSGGDCSRAGSCDAAAALFITPDARVVVTTNAESAQLFDRELQGLGFQLKERPWHEPRSALIEDLIRGRSVASDAGFSGTDEASTQLTGLRIPLTSFECRRLREFGPELAHAVEATCRNCEPGQTETEIAGEVAHRLLRHRILPERIQVCADGRSQTYPHWTFGEDQVQRYVVVTAIGRKNGLCLGTTRTVSFGAPPKEVADDHHRTMVLQATGMYFTQAPWGMFEIWNRLARIYEKFGCDDQWEKTEQAEIIGYELCEMPLIPRSEFQIAPRMAVYWHPAIGTAVSGDSILVGEGEFEVLTPAEGWPKVKVVVKGTTIYRPEILVRTS